MATLCLSIFGGTFAGVACVIGIRRAIMGIVDAAIN